MRQGRQCHKGQGTIHILRQDWMGGKFGGSVLKMSSFADVQYCIYADIVESVGGSKKVQNYAYVIYGWSPVGMQR